VPPNRCIAKKTHKEIAHAEVDSVDFDTSDNVKGVAAGIAFKNHHGQHTEETFVPKERARDAAEARA